MVRGLTPPNGARTISYMQILTNIHVLLKITTHAEGSVNSSHALMHHQPKSRQSR